MPTAHLSPRASPGPIFKEPLGNTAESQLPATPSAAPVQGTSAKSRLHVPVDAQLALRLMDLSKTQCGHHRRQAAVTRATHPKSELTLRVASPTQHGNSTLSFLSMLALVFLYLPLCVTTLQSLSVAVSFRRKFSRALLSFVLSLHHGVFQQFASCCAHLLLELKVFFYLFRAREYSFRILVDILMAILVKELMLVTSNQCCEKHVLQLLHEMSADGA